MKIHTFLYFVFFLQFNCIAQVKTNQEYVTEFPPVSAADEMYNMSEIEVLPEFEGGIKAFYKYIANNYRYPNVESLKGRVYVEFVIEKDGSLADMKIIRDVGFGTGEEAIRVLQNCPKWKPGFFKGMPVRVRYTLPINISF
ncbi:energy transducer TonB [Flavobacterium sp.]|uniref:energy transducer TonB n=1 Tax=Flavobacterium sp. TaxID=239 RepID=UPI00286E7506|nr:energy transducer TonB [Flavobacterium sp.]